MLTIYFTGVGLTENPPLRGAGAGEESKPLLPVLVQFGEITLEPALVRLSPGHVGIAETQFKVPVNEAGDYPVSVRVGDGLSASAVVSVSNVEYLVRERPPARTNELKPRNENDRFVWNASKSRKSRRGLLIHNRATNGRRLSIT